MDKKNINTRKISTKNVSSRNMSTKNVSSRKVSSKDIDAKNVSTRNISTKNVSAKKVGSISSNICNVSKLCGGCQFQGVQYSEQIKIKQGQVNELFKGICNVSPVVGMKNPYHYRNKVHAVVGENRNHQIVTGTYREGTHQIVPVESCMLEDEIADKIIETLRGLFASFKYKPYNEDKRTGLIRHVLIKRGFQTNQIMVVIVTGTLIVPSKKNFVEALKKVHPEITTIIQNINDKSTSMVLGDRENIWYGKGYIEDTLCDCLFRISSKSFYQINPVQTENLYHTAIEMAKLTGKETIIDAYCGIGTIGIVASKYVNKVIGIELNKDAVKDAKMNAKQNQAENCDFYEGDAGKFMTAMTTEQKDKLVDVVFMDPPRSGSTEEFLKAVIKLKPKKVIYISCNPETQVRDIRILEKGGYKPMECIPFDMFPYTSHVESIVLMTKCGCWGK